MYWNYRVLDHGEVEEGEDRYEVFEVYYTNDDKLIGYSKIAIIGSTVEDLREEMEYIEKAFEKPVIPVSLFHQDEMVPEREIEDGPSI